MKKAKTVLLVVLLAASIAIFLVPQKLQAVDPIIMSSGAIIYERIGV